MRNLNRRLQKLEAGFTDTTGLVPHSEAWLAYRVVAHRLLPQKTSEAVFFQAAADASADSEQARQPQTNSSCFMGCTRCQS